MTDYHSAAYWLAGRAVLTARRPQPLTDLDISEPDAVLAAAGKEIADTLAAHHTDAALLSLAVGAAAQREGAARNAAWSDAVAPLPRRRDARQFVANERQAIERLARALLAERKLSADMVSWILNAKPQKLAA